MATHDWLTVATVVLLVSGCLVLFGVSVRNAVRYPDQTNAFLSLASAFLGCAVFFFSLAFAG